MIPISSSARIWIATGHTDMRKGMQDLSLLVQESLGRDSFAGDVFVFRGRGGSLIKAWWRWNWIVALRPSGWTMAGLSGR
jgi:transposase